MKFVTLILLAGAFTQAHAHQQYFCAPQAEAAVTAFANVNATISESVLVLPPSDGTTFVVLAKELGTGEDTYDVVTTGGHDCTVLSVTVRGTPTKRP